MLPSWCCLIFTATQTNVSISFHVSVIFMNVKENFFGPSILMAYVNRKGHSFYNNVQNDTERLFHPQCSTHESDWSCVRVRLFILIMRWSNGQLPLIPLFALQRIETACQHAGKVVYTLQCLATNKTRNIPNEILSCQCFLCLCLENSWKYRGLKNDFQAWKQKTIFKMGHSN